MANYEIKQYRYYTFDTTIGNNIDLTGENVIIMPGSNKKFEQVGIQTIPGVEFYFNGDQTGAIMIGPSGIYEIRSPYANISSIQITGNSKELINNYPGGYLIIDVIIGEETANGEEGSVEV